MKRRKEGRILPRLITSQHQKGVNSYAKMITDYMDSQNLNFFSYIDEDGDNVVTIPVNMKNIPSLIFKLYIEADGKCSLVTRIGVCEANRSGLLEKLNKFNNYYSFVKFSVSETNNIMNHTNFFVNEHGAGELAMNYVRSVMSICDSVSKELVQFIWEAEEFEASLNELNGGDIDFDDGDEPFSEEGESYNCDAGNGEAPDETEMELPFPDGALSEDEILVDDYIPDEDEDDYEEDYGDEDQYSDEDCYDDSEYEYFCESSEDDLEDEQEDSDSGFISKEEVAAMLFPDVEGDVDFSELFGENDKKRKKPVDKPTSS